MSTNTESTDNQFGDAGYAVLNRKKVRYYRHLGANGPDLISRTTGQYNGAGLAILTVYTTPELKSIGMCAALYGRKVKVPSEALWLTTPKNGAYPDAVWGWFKKYCEEELNWPEARIYMVGSLRWPYLLSRADADQEGRLVLLREFVKDTRLGQTNQARAIYDIKLPELQKKSLEEKNSRFQYFDKQPPPDSPWMEDAEDAFALSLYCTWYCYNYQEGALRLKWYAPQSAD